ncbi:S24 family peptidase [Roseiarcaceae bacterium H3SJ34-1]|uniref:S24 family peptidase n=1 Tax=Terripilifer ovatus TaxID=3032367 RepID=UPI003AB98165|nr:S24 family peptidase [Roseiarcaceae bacterium H3SJ34-1]
MAVNPEAYIDWIAKGVMKPGKSKGGLADALRVHPSQVTRIMGGRRLRADEIGRIAEYLEEPPPSPVSGFAEDPQSAYRAPSLFPGEPDLPVFAAVEGSPGIMVVTTEPIEYASRPLALRHVPDSYAVLVVGDAMEPAYEAGDMVIVHPRKPAIKGKNAIFVSEETHGEFRASIKRLVQETSDRWMVRQFNPPKDFHLLKRDWPRALRIIGKFDGS